jgi:hypothetical protein
MSLLAPKLIVTPLLIASASLAGRRWGAALSGWLVALPLTSGPVLVFIALELGTVPATTAASGSLVGALAQVGYIAGYVVAARRYDWPGALLAASAAFAVVAAVVPAAPPLVLYVGSLAAIALVLRFLGGGAGAQEHAPTTEPGRWDIPARAVVATAIVVVITMAAPIVGGRPAGILATFPVYVSVLTTFAHRVAGPGEARQVLFGLTLGLPGFATFFFVMASLVAAAGLWAALGVALVSAIGLNLAILAGRRWVTPGS